MQRLDLPTCADAAQKYNQMTVQEYFEQLASIDRQETQILLERAVRLTRKPLLEVIENGDRCEKAA